MRSTQLAGLAPAGCRYAYDIIVQVGLESFLNGRPLREIQRILHDSTPSVQISTSSLDELRRRFLFYLGKMHRRAGAPLADWLRQRGDTTWLIDGTLEPGTPVFFGVFEADAGVLLDCWKVPSENADDLASCLEQAAGTYGRPCRVLHDLNSAMGLACERALSDVPHHVCHFHFAADIGEDLLNGPQKALSGRLRQLQLQARLREQRKSQTEWLRGHSDARPAASLVQQLLSGGQCDQPWSETLSREVLLAFHFWILDYPADGSRRGFPFDPYTLYLHRRIVRAHATLNRLLCLPHVAAQVTRALHNLRDNLRGYCTDARVVAAAEEFELAFHEFERLRDVLRLWANGPSPMRYGYHLTAGQGREVQSAVNRLRAEYLERLESCQNDSQRRIYAVIASHIEKYLPQLMPSNRHRTTTPLEAYWSDSKRAVRHTQGRRKLTRSFDALPPELMLVPNLNNSDYLEIVLSGSLDNLPAKFAESADAGIPYGTWRQSNTSLNIGRLPKRLLRRDDFPHDLADLCDLRCRT
jgi:hypothetical protein